MQTCTYRGKLRKESECVTEMKALRKKTWMPTRCDDLRSEIAGLSKNRFDIWTSDCDGTRHLDTCSSASLHVQHELVCDVCDNTEFTTCSFPPR